MKHSENSKKLVKRYCASKKAAIKTSSELDHKIMQEALQAQTQSSPTPAAARPPQIRRIIRQNKFNKFVGAAAILLLLMVISAEVFQPQNGFSTVYAAALDHVRQAGSFTCMEVFQASYEKDGKKGTYIVRQKWMFKEPALERHESLTSPWPEYVGETTIRDYGKRRQLTLRPASKRALLYDFEYEYTVDDKTGELHLTQLNTRLRDRLLSLCEGDVEDLGTVILNGQSVRKLQSRRKKRVTFLWTDPKTDHPVQIEHTWPGTDRQPVLYASIQINTDLDDRLFSLEAPEDYTVDVEEPGYTADQKKRMAKMMYLGKLCFVYASKHEDRFPETLEALVIEGIISEAALKKVRSAPDCPDAKAVIQYCQPDHASEDPSAAVILYESFGPETVVDPVTVVMQDGHGEQMPVRVLQQYLKAWPARQKKVAIYMAYLYGYCQRYAQGHQGHYPDKLTDLVHGDISLRRIKGFQTAWGQHDGSIQIQYRKPRPGNDPAREVLLYESLEQGADGQAVVTFADGRCEIVPEANQLDQLID